MYEEAAWTSEVSIVQMESRCWCPFPPARYVMNCLTWKKLPNLFVLQFLCVYKAGKYDPHLLQESLPDACDEQLVFYEFLGQKASRKHPESETESF